MKKDRRSGKERRSFERVNVVIDTEWETATSGGKQAGTISDVSNHGCYVLCSGEVEDGEAVKIFLPLSDGMKVEFAGEIVNHFFEIGFAVRFGEISEAQADFLENFIDTLQNSPKIS